MNELKAKLLWLIRGGLLLVPLMPLLCGHSQLSHGPFPPWFFPDITPKHFAFRILIEVLFGLWLLVVVVDRTYVPRWRGAVAAATVFVAVIAVADVCGQNPQQSIFSNFERMQGLVGYLHLLAFFVVLVAVFDDSKHWRRFFAMSLFAAGVVATYAFFQWWHNYLGFQVDERLRMPAGWEWLNRMHNQPERVNYQFRVDARLGAPVYVGAFMMMHVFVATLLLLRARSRWRRVGCGALIVVFAFTVYTSATRSALASIIAGFFVATAIAAVAHPRPRVRRIGRVALAAVVVLAVVAVVCIAYPPAFLREFPFVRRLNVMWENGNIRMPIWGVALRGFAERPILGWGEENFQYVFDKYFDPRMVTGDVWYDHPHNVFLGWLVAGGVVGAAAYLLLLLTPLRQLWARQRSALPLVERCVITGLWTAYVVFLLWMFDNLSTHVLFFAVLGYVHRSVPAMFPAAATAVRRGWRGGKLAAAAAAIVVATGVAIDKLSVANIRAAAGLTDALSNPFDERTQTWRMLRVLDMPTFGKREIREQATTLAHRFWVDPRVPRRDGSTYVVPDAKRQEVVDIGLRTIDQEIAESGSALRLRTLMHKYTLLFAVQRYQQCLDVLQQARALAPQRQLILIEMGRCYMLQDRLDEALDAFRTAHELWPRYVEPKVLLAAAAIQAGNAAVTAEMLEKLHSESAPAGRPDPRLVEALRSRRRFDVLMRLYGRLVDTAEKYAGTPRWPPEQLLNTYVSLADAQAEAGRRDEAIQTVRRGIASVRAAVERQGRQPAVAERLAQRGRRVIETIRSGRSLVAEPGTEDDAGQPPPRRQ